MESIQAPPPTAPLTRPVPAVYASLAVTSLATAGIHFAVMGEHFDEYVAFGLFFSVVAWLQALWALGVVVAPTRPLLVAGLAGNLVVVAVWVVSRTTGLPIGPESGTAEPAAFLDVLSTVLEAGIVAATATLLLRRRDPRDAARGRSASLVVAGLGVALVVLTTAGVAAGGHEEEGHAEEEHAEEVAATDASGLARIELGDGRMLQAIVDESGGGTLMHLTFFDADGEELAVDSVSVTGVSPSGEEVDVPVQRFEPGHYAATLDLTSGEWEFEVHGVAAHGGEVDAAFHAEVP